MDKDVSVTRSHEKQPSMDSTFISEDKNPADNASVFVNQAEKAWQEMRKDWAGNRSQKTQRVPKDPVLSWSLTYDDLLLTHDPFPQRIPLPEMVDFLVDIWHEEGLFD
ncbi:uncharacterized protein LOC113338714 [Papaver somniferum]|uniref:uncharacterized protein LOC113338714 n=1 Tax=Papaver somniferum TaxID=3469 RepID=UPI000E6FDE94|nr:uncharacterized protein LOC113338714 [Papaver somniferum]XP_026439875.1 uncharacterized protein LOC113338714 [Papaver somniferum]